MPWLDPSITLRWGPYTRLDGDEQKSVVDLTVAAKNAGVITKRQAVEKLSSAGVFEVENVEAALEALEEEQTKNDERNAAQQAQQAENDAKTLHAAGKAAADGRGKPGTPGQPGGPQEAASD